jgi:60 kDa SS-A/Ro ribonucleoprotein
MANKTLFQKFVNHLVPSADTRNEAGGLAYQLTPKAALVQYAMTGALNGTFYASAETQLTQVLQFANEVPASFVAQTAVYCRQRGYMKDMPALLAATLAQREIGLLDQIFDRVIDDGKMLRNFVQIVRSGVTGRKSLGSAPKRLVKKWLAQRSDAQVFRATVGQSPSLTDIVRMVHPRPSTAARTALYGWMTGREYVAADLPSEVQAFEAYKQGASTSVPDVPFQMLTALNLGTAEWTEIARTASWQMTRMNLNTFARHGVFTQPEMVRVVADRLRNPALVKRSRCFPYQLLVAYQNITSDLPKEIAEALQDALEIATQNVPSFSGRVWVFPDVSGSMSSSVTGYRAGSTSQVRCIDVAGLIAATVLRRCDDAEVLPFECSVTPLRLNGRDSVMTNAKKLASIGGGGTNCSAPLAELNRRKAEGDLIIYVSDNQSWVDTMIYQTVGGEATATMKEWTIFKKRNPRAKMICIDIQPYATRQTSEQSDILNIGGFSDTIWEVIDSFTRSEFSSTRWVDEIEKIAL